MVKNRLSEAKSNVPKKVGLGKGSREKLRKAKKEAEELKEKFEEVERLRTGEIKDCLVEDLDDQADKVQDAQKKAEHLKILGRM